jgi:hypothetical protein
MTITSFVTVTLLLLLLLVVVLSISLSVMIPSASAIGCAPLSLTTDGPYQSSLQGVVSSGVERVRDKGTVKQVYTVLPGTSVNMTFGVLYPYGQYTNRTVIPDFIFYPENISTTDWLQASYSPYPVTFGPYDDKANVTVTLNLAKYAPQGDYCVMLDARIPGGGQCSYGGGAFMLQVGLKEQPTTVTLTTTEVSTKTLSATGITSLSTTTVTSTTTVIEQITDSSTYTWAIGATIAAVAFAVAVVILLLRRT